MEKPIGNYRKIFSARSKDMDVLSRSQDGGIVSTIYIYGLENGFFDGVVVAETTKDYTPIAKIARTKDEVLNACGTKYSVCPNMSLIKSAVKEYALEKIGFVGTPCQVQAMRKMINYPSGFRHTNYKINLVVGIFCMENFPSLSMKILIEKYAKVKLENVRKTDIGKGKLWVYTKDSEDPITIPLKETHIFEQNACHVCLDYTSELADISTGSVGSPDGWSTVIIRTENGEKFINKLISNGKIEVKDIDFESKLGYPLLEKLSIEKKTKNMNTLKLRREMGLLTPY